jgi:NAD+ diphosphatase
VKNCRAEEYEIREVFMIQDIFPHIYHNEYKPVAPDSNSIILAYENGKCFFHREENSNTIALPRFNELEGQLSDLYENYIYIFSLSMMIAFI